MEFLLPEQLQNVLRQLVGLGQHGGSRLAQDVVLGEFHHLLRHVDVADAGFGCRQVLVSHAQVVDGVVDTVLHRTEGSTLAGHPVDRQVDLADRPVGQFITGDLDVVHAQSRAEVLEGIEWLRRAADNGDAGAQFFLANLYYTGQGVARDPDEARRLWQTAAAQGHPTAAIALVEPARVTAEPPADMPFPVALREDAPLPPPSLRDGPPVRPSDIGRAEAAPVVAAVAPVVTPVPRHVEVPQDAPRRAVPEYRPSPGKGGKATVKGGKGKKSATAVAARGQGGKRAVASPGAGGRKPAVAASKARAAPAAKAAVPTAKPAAAKARAAKPAATKPAKARAR